MTARTRTAAAAGAEAGCSALAGWAQHFGRATAEPGRVGGLRFAFYGRVSTEGWQDPVTSRARQRAQADALVRGHGRVAAEFFDAGQSRTVAWARRPQAALLVAALADPGRGWDAVVIGEYERAFFGSQYGLMAPLFEHYGIQLWMPETGGLLLAQLPALHSQLTRNEPAGAGRGARSTRSTRLGTDVIALPDVAGIIGYLREHRVALTWDQPAATLRAGTSQVITTNAS
jgi:hypothetical protein